MNIYEYVNRAPFLVESACGWYTETRIVKDKIYGFVSPKEGLVMEMVWDKYGYPVDLQQYPSKYYLRLVVRE